mgnify:CR=1 FL=1
MGQTTGYIKDYIKPEVLIMGENKALNEARYIHGEFGKGTWTFYSGHDPEDYQHRVGDPPFATAAQRLLDPAGELPGVELGLLALRVDRHDATGPVADQVDDRVRHLQPAAVGVGLALEGDLQRLFQLPLRLRLGEECRLPDKTASRRAGDAWCHPTP